MTAATSAPTLTPADVLFRAERRLAPMIARLGAGDPMVQMIARTYDALYAISLTGQVSLIAEPDSDDDMALVNALGLGAVTA